jgi:putative spermidine/putrescine transport system permease protein
MTHRPSVALHVWVALVGGFLLAPIVVAVCVSFSAASQLVFPPQGFSLRWYAALWNDSQLRSAFVVSIGIGLGSTAIALAVGTAAALAINHYVFPGRAALRTFLLLPLSLPGIVLGLGLLFAFAALGLRPGVIATIISHSVIGVPFVVYFLLATLASYDLDLERASYNLGAGRWYTFTRVTLPIIRPGLQLGAVFAFLSSFDNVSLSLFLSRNDTLPLRLLQSIQFYSDPTVAAASGTIIAMSIAIMLWIRKSLVLSLDPGSKP